jgi:enterochelin esterase family protein
VLQHGSGDNQRAWTEHGKAHWILDNLIAQGLAKSMIVMMIDGHPRGSVPRNDELRRSAALAAFRDELMQEAIPLVESRYRVSKQPTERGIVGLSMGGGQSVAIGLNHLDQFAWVGSMSGAINRNWIAKPLSDVAATNGKLRMLWLIRKNLQHATIGKPGKSLEI